MQFQFKKPLKAPLTIEMVIANIMSANECVKYFRPDWTDEECDYYVWNETCYPFSTEKFIEQLNEKLFL